MGTTIRSKPSRSAVAQVAWCVALAGLLQATLLAAPAAAACHIAAFSPSSVEVEETAGEVTLTVVLQGGQPSCEGTVDYATEDGTATAGGDYESASGTLTFTQGDDREEDITIVLLTDDASEGSEDFQVVLTNPTGSISGTGDPATVTITEGGDADEPTTEPTDEPATDEPATDEPAPDVPTGEPEPVEDEFPWVPVVIVLLILVGGGVAFAVRGNRSTG